MMMACCMHFRAIPKRKSLVILMSQGKFTKILPSAVIFPLEVFEPLPTDATRGTVKAPVC
jgi:hypothetical protein